MNYGNMFNQMSPNNMCNQMGGMNNMCNNMNTNNQMGNNMNSNMFNNMDLMGMILQMNSMNQALFNQMMNNMKNIQNIQNTQNMPNCNNAGGNDVVRNLNENNYDPFSGNSQARVNINFQLTTGKKIIMPVPINITVYQLLNAFFEKFGILNPALQCKVNFVFNGLSLKRFINNLPNNANIHDVRIMDGSTVLVVDLQNILGA